MEDIDPSVRKPRTFDHLVHFFFTNKFVDHLSKTTDVKKTDAYVLFNGGEVPGSQADIFEAEYRRFVSRDTYVNRTKKGNALFSTLLHVNKSLVIQWWVWTYCHTATRLISPIIIVFYVQKAQPGEEKWALWVLIVAVCVVVFLQQVLIGLKTWASELLIYNMRYQLPNLIYGKILSLNSTSIASISRGSLISMAVGDIRSLEMAAVWALYAPAALTEMIVIFIILAILVSPTASAAGCVMVLLAVPIQVWTVSEMGKCKRAVTRLADERLRLTSEAVQGILTVKSQCWEEPMVDSILAVRLKETEYIWRTVLLRVVNTYFTYFFLPTAILLMMIVYSYMGNELTPAITFLILGYILTPRSFLMSFFVLAAQTLYEGKIAIDRLNDFMEIPEPPLPPNMIEQAPHLPKGTIQMNGVDYDWDFTLGKTHHNPSISGRLETISPGDPRTQVMLDPLPTLGEVKLDTRPGELIAIAGNVGAGKTSLFAALLGELQPLPRPPRGQAPPAEGEPQLRQPVVIGSVAYAPQPPWLFAGTVRANILFGSEYDEEWYNVVVAACALVTDFTILPNGDRTMLGAGGTGLSGGQKSRVGLARAAYMKADITLLDDPLSSLDARVARHVFNNVISNKGILKTSTRLLATHLRAYFRSCDRTLLLRDGRVVALGTWDELKGRGIHELVVNSFEDTAPGPTRESTDQPRKAEGETGAETEETDDAASESSETSSAEVDIDQLAAPKSKGPPPEAQPPVSRDVGTDLQVSKLNGVMLYFAALGGILIPLVVLVFRGLSEACYNVAIWWIAYKAESGFIDAVGYIVYGSLIGAIIVFSVGATFFVPGMFVRAATVLHEDMMRGAFGTRFSFFQSRTGKGSITDCVARDIGAVSDLLPLTLYDFMVQTVNIFARCVMWCVAIPYMAILVVPFFVTIFFIWLKFSKAYSQVGRLGAITTAPIVNAFLVAQSGLPIIRTTNSEARLRKEFKQNSIDSAIWNLAGHCSVKWMTVRICYAAVAMTIIFSILAAALNSQISYILVAIVLNGMIGLGQFLPNLIRYAAVVLAGTHGVERIVAFSQLPQEDEEHEQLAFDAGKKVKVPQNWPTSALVEYESVAVSYSIDGPLVLRDFNVTMRPGTSVCVIGRTGSGKSTLVLSLFRMVSIRQGTLLFDGVDTATIPLHTLRAQLAIIPQEPVMFSGTIRSNLDPWGLVSDDQIWSMLRQVGLYNMITDMGGLDAPVTENQKVSLGQKQLMCLARAFLKDSWLIALDEATASMDMQTEAAVQTMLKTWTSGGDAGRLLLVVAHRLQATESADQLLVLSEGLLVEDGAPEDLAQLPDGYYAGMLAAMRAIANS